MRLLLAIFTITILSISCVVYGAQSVKEPQVSKKEFMVKIDKIIVSLENRKDEIYKSIEFRKQKLNELMTFGMFGGSPQRTMGMNQYEVHREYDRYSIQQQQNAMMLNMATQAATQKINEEMNEIRNIDAVVTQLKQLKNALVSNQMKYSDVPKEVKEVIKNYK